MNTAKLLEVLYFNHASDELCYYFGFSQLDKLKLDYCDFMRNDNLPYVLITQSAYNQASKLIADCDSELEKIITISKVLQCQIKCFDHFYLQENIPQNFNLEKKHHD